MADSVIDAGEMDYFTGFRADFRLSRQEEIEAKGMTLAEAIGILRESDKETREELVSRCRALSVSDGFCARLEALLIMGVARALDDLYGEVSHIYSFPKNIFDIPTSCLIYIEGEPAECVDNLVERNYRGLFSEFRLGGFEFIYIPEIIRHYREAEPGLMERIAGFIVQQTRYGFIAQHHSCILSEDRHIIRWRHHLFQLSEDGYRGGSDARRP